MRLIFVWILIFSIASPMGLAQFHSSDAGKSAELEALTDSLNIFFKQINELRSFILIQDNEVLIEEYFHGFEANNIQHIRSTTKTIMSVLIGILIHKEYLDSTNISLSVLLKDIIPDQELNKLSSITLQHILDMRGGWAWDEHGGDMMRWSAHPQPLNYLLQKPISDEPGTRYNYNSASVHILSYVIEKYSGMSLLAFADTYLFKPLAIEDVRWMRLKDGIENGGYGLEIKPIDLAKITSLYLNDGRWQNTTIIPENWIKASFDEPHYFNRDIDLFKNSGYRNLWWYGEVRSNKVYYGLGYGGQFMTVVPTMNMILIINQDWYYASDVREREYKVSELLNFIIKHRRYN